MPHRRNEGRRADTSGRQRDDEQIGERERLDAVEFPDRCDPDRVVGQHGDHRGKRRARHAPARDQQRVRRDRQRDEHQREREVVAVFLRRDEDRAVEARVHVHHAGEAQKQKDVAPVRVAARHQREDIVEVDPNQQEQKAADDQIDERHLARDAAHAFHVALFPQVRDDRRGDLDHRAVGRQHGGHHVGHRRVDGLLGESPHAGQHRLVDNRHDVHRRASEVLPKAVNCGDRQQSARASRPYGTQVDPAGPERVDEQYERRHEIDQHVSDDELLEVDRPERVERNFGRDEQPQRDFVDERRDDGLVEGLQPGREEIEKERREAQRNQQ